jgi:hypothetical protein
MMISGHARTGHLDGVGVAELVRGEAPLRARVTGDAAQLGAGGGGRARASARGAVDDAEQRPDRQPAAGREPWFELPAGPLGDADLAASAALAAPHQQRPAAPVRVGLGERRRLADARAGAPRHDDQAARSATCACH